MTEPFVRESGSGPTVVCLHASASSSTQWRALAERLSGRFRVLAVDLHGCGRTSAWAQPRPLRLDNELALLDVVWRGAGARFHIVGHSYGGAVLMGF
jgi:pimeloyl-ACP methyl ester carboxylesterase